MLDKLMASRCEPQAAADPLEQHHAKLLLKRIDLAAKRWLGQPKGAGGGGQRAFLGGDEKRPRPVPIEVH